MNVMAKFNKPKTKTTKVINYAGGESYKSSDKLEFISILFTSFLKNQFYRSETETIQKIKDLVSKLDKKFVAKASIYARTVFGMRSVSHLVAGEIAYINRSKKGITGETWTKHYFDNIIYRCDDMMEILSYYLHTYGKPIPAALRKGFRTAIQRFNRYQIGKYKKSNSDLSLIDLVKLIRPKANQNLNDLIHGTLESPETWEVELTKAGQNGKSKKEAWTKLVQEKKLGYFALLRNLRNILQEANEITPEVVKQLLDEKLIKKSLVLPFRFLTAINEIEKINIEGSRQILMALNKAVDISLNNVPKFDGKTLIALDTSGSMVGKPAEIGSLFSAILYKNNDADFMNFSSKAIYQNLNPMDSTLTIAKGVKFQNGGTDFHCIFQTAKKKYDRIFILSDMQGWIGFDTPVADYKSYKIKTGANPIIYSFDLAGYGTMQFPEKNVYCIAGFSEKIFDIIRFMESDKNAMINEIEKINLDAPYSYEEDNETD